MQSRWCLRASKLAFEPGKFAYVFIIVLSISGCSSTLSVGPEKVFSLQDDAAQLKAFAALPAPGNTLDSQQTATFITARMYAIDIEFSKYRSDLTKERELERLGFDAATVGLAAATTVAGGSSLKAILGAATTATAGTGAAIDKDVFIEQTIQVLLNQMEVDRLAIRNRILSNISTNASSYTVYQGLIDLEDYYRAGTLAGALESLSATIGNNAQQNKNLTNGITQSARVLGLSSAASTSTSLTPAGARVRGLVN